MIMSENKAYNVQDVVHYFVIKVYDKIGGNLIEFLKWDNLKWELRCKYDWYFKYRAALAQVKYPKYEVAISWGNEPATGRTLQEIKVAKIRSKKAKVTEFQNKLAKYKGNWDSLFPIDQDVSYINALAKIELLKQEVQCLESENKSAKTLAVVE